MDNFGFFLNFEYPRKPVISFVVKLFHGNMFVLELLPNYGIDRSKGKCVIHFIRNSHSISELIIQFSILTSNIRKFQTLIFAIIIGISYSSGWSYFIIMVFNFYLMIECFEYLLLHCFLINVCISFGKKYLFKCSVHFYYIFSFG
jgi:hypothetical protein